MAKRRKKNKKKVGVIIFIILILVGFGAYYIWTHPEEAQKYAKKVEPEKKLQIVDEDSKTRPIAVMINNNHEAWPHAGLQDAYLTYEILAEGGITRMMALFKDKNTEKIGSVRSARPYYLDYALENDAIYVHYGWSEKAKSDISSLGVDNINGLTVSSVFWRDKSLNKATEHTVFTSMEKINEYAKEKGYDRDTNKDLLLNYSVDEIDLSKREDAVKADTVFMKYSYYTDTSYEYDSANKVYKRFMSDTAHVDAVTGEQYTAKNIIITPIATHTYDSYGRLELDDIGSGEGYFITDGYAIPITWSKDNKNMDGDEIKVNDGNTFIQITPPSEEVKIEGNTTENEE